MREYKVGETVTVCAHELEFWRSLHDDGEVTFTIAKVSMAEHPCCVGHTYSLVTECGRHLSGLWFDEEQAARPDRSLCNSEGPYYTAEDRAERDRVYAMMERSLMR